MIHSRFSPSTMSPELLEKVLIQRHHIASVLEGHLRASAEPDASRHHLLLVGPRGIGKSHLIAVIVNRLKADASLRDKMAIAWLPEDPWAVSNFADLLREILRALGGDVTRLHWVAPKDIEARAWNFILQELGGRRLLVVVENLDEILHNFKVKDQQKWRGLVQNTGLWAILAGACSLTLNFTDHDAPFYGFFAVTPLAALSSGEAVEFMVKMAETQGNTAMLAQLQTAEGRAKVRCVYHLAGGSPRVFVTFFQMLAEGLDGDLATPVLKLIDAMTPYYQSQMKTVSAQQRKILEVLCRSSGAMNVKVISQECGVTPQVASSQLGQLAERRFVNVAREGRESNYDLADPLMRTCVDVQENGFETLRFIAAFQCNWFTYEERTGRIKAGSCDPPIAFWCTVSDPQVRQLALAKPKLAVQATWIASELWGEPVERISAKDRKEVALLIDYLKNARAASAVAAMSASV